jgi:hypothetical protein
MEGRLMEPADWKAQEPPADFADRLMERVDAEIAPPIGAPSPARQRAARRFLYGGGLALAASVALVVGWHAAHEPTRGEAIAADRAEVAMGSRAVAVLERGARVTWNGDDVTQTEGDVFYRVAPGGAFRVHAPGADVQVLGTCFRVRVERAEDAVNGRDVKAGAIGAALGAAALVSVYEGKVAVSHASERVTLTAGESARADGTGVHHERARAASESAGTAASAQETEDPLLAANANLAASVHEYKQRLESIESEKKAIEKRLGEAQERLAAAENDGQVPVSRGDYDLSQDDWKQLAANGEVRARMPCSADEWTLDAKSLTKMGLAPQDAQPIQEALKQVNAQAWSTVRPLCIKAVQGNAQIVDMLGMATCQQLVFQAGRQAKENTDEEMHEVAEIRAGMRPLPKNLDDLGSVGKMMYEMSGESSALEKSLAQSIGPDDAHRFVYGGDEGCWNNSTWAAGPRPKMP